MSTGSSQTAQSIGHILFCGDTHGCFEHVIDAVVKQRPAAIVFLGDIQPQRPLHDELKEIVKLAEIWWIHGNHDTDSDADYDNLFGSALADRNLHGRVEEIAGIRVAGLGGIFRRQIWAPPEPILYDTPSDFAARCGKGNLWRGGLPRKHRSSIFPSDYAQLADEHADILVTHEAPSCHPHGFFQIDELARRLGVRAAFHGHHHDRLDYHRYSDGLGFHAYGVGLCGITDERGFMVRPGDSD